MKKRVESVWNGWCHWWCRTELQQWEINHATMDGLELGQDQVGRTVKVEQFEDKENVQVNY